MPVKYVNANLPCRKGKFAIVSSRFNNIITDRLVTGAIDALVREGEVSEDNITVVKVPGAIELALVAEKIASEGKYDAIIALGCVIRGSTYHFEIVANESAKCLAQVALKYKVPVINGVLTVENIDQAVQRAGAHLGNKGSEAASSALEMVNLLGKV